MESSGLEQMHQLDMEASLSEQWNNLLEKSVLYQWTQLYGVQHHLSHEYDRKP